MPRLFPRYISPITDSWGVYCRLIGDLDNMCVRTHVRELSPENRKDHSRATAEFDLREGSRAWPKAVGLRPAPVGVPGFESQPSHACARRNPRRTDPSRWRFEAYQSRAAKRARLISVRIPALASCCEQLREQRLRHWIRALPVAARTTVSDRLAPVRIPALASCCERPERPLWSGDVTSIESDWWLARPRDTRCGKRSVGRTSAVVSGGYRVSAVVRAQYCLICRVAMPTRCAFPAQRPTGR